MLCATQVATGGVDRNVVVLNRETGVAAPALTGHTKRVDRVAFHPLHTPHHRQCQLSRSHAVDFVR